MSEPTSDASPAVRWSHRPGSWLGVVGARTAVLLPPEEKDRAARLWALVDADADVDAVLDALLAAGLSGLADFALLGLGDADVRVLVRGERLRVEGSDADGSPVVLTAGAGRTWVEQRLALDAPLGVVADTGDETAGADGADLPLAGGLVRLARLDRPARPVAVAPGAPVEIAAAAIAGSGPVASASVEEPQPAEQPAIEQPAIEEVAIEELATELIDLDADADADTDDGAHDGAGPVPAPTVDPAIDPLTDPLPDVLAAGPAADLGSPAPDPTPEEADTPAVPLDIPPAPPAPPAPPLLPGPPPAPIGPPPPAPPLPIGSWESTPLPEATPFDVDHDGHTSAGSRPASVSATGPAAAETVAPGAGAPSGPPAGPPVARLQISDGQSVVVDRVVIIGRAPEARRFSPSEQPLLVSVPSRLHEISSTHVEVRPGAGADHGSAVVTDMGSTNGTVLTQPGLPAETLKPGVAVQLIPGAVINLGDGITIQVVRP
ncbi:hypothetical protein [Nocardioides sp.]|uniref:hypothetical protein n=1 Tax=Nocardioides sp. TaxID=35761 RepID=UPI0035148BCB